MKKAVALVLCTLVAGAVHAASLKQGTQEIVVEGLFDPDAPGDQQLDLSITYGQFIQDNLEVGVEGSFSDNDLLSTYGIAGFAEYNFDQGTELVPFVGAGIGWINTDPDEGSSEDAVAVSVSAGVKYFLAENVAIRADVTYTWASEDVFLEDDDVSDTDLAVNLGMAFYIP